MTRAPGLVPAAVHIILVSKRSVQGLGWRSYTAALRALVELVRDAQASRA